MSGFDWYASFCALIGYLLGALLSPLIDLYALRIKVESLMSTRPGSQWFPERVCEAKALLALHGHRMTRRTREALTVWLAEHGGGE